MNRNEPGYRFALISDIHIDRENGGENTYFIYAERNFERALRVINKRKCDFIISAGDQITNASGQEEEWRVYRSIIEASGYKGGICAAMGNHELRSAKYGLSTVGECIADFIRYTEPDRRDISRAELNAPYYYFIEPVFGDAYIFMATEIGVDVNQLDDFSDAQMAWVERLVKRFTGERRRIFLIQHANLYGFGAGDDPSSPAYKGAIRTADKDGRAFKNNLRFKSLIEEYRDIIWVSGHTHTDFEDNVNYCEKSEKACHMIHIPALCGTTRLSRDRQGNRTLDRRFYEDTSQGYIVDVYGDRTVFSGINFYYDSLYPQYTFTVKNQLSEQ